jgi:hypothetical protein
MTQDKHTPGPWYVGAQNDALYVIDGPPSPGPYDGPIPKDYGPEVVAEPNWRLKECAANARLIAAAPDMLDALRATLGELLCVRDYIDDASRGQLRYRGASDLSEMAGDDLTRLDEQIATVRAVIACATGEAAE